MTLLGPKDIGGAELVEALKQQKKKCTCALK
jgi:hypothetical protein